MSSKFAKKYLNGVAENIPNVVSKSHTYYKPLGTLFKDIDFQKDSVPDIISKYFKNLKGSTSELEKLQEWEINSCLKNLKKELTSKLDLASDNALIKAFDDVIKLSKNEKIDIIDIFLNSEKVKKMSPERYQQAQSLINKFFSEKILKPFNIDFATMSKDINFEKIKVSINNLADEFPDLLSADDSKLICGFVERFEKNPNEFMDALINDLTTQENYIKVSKTLDSLQNKIHEGIKDLKDSNLLKEFLDDQKILINKKTYDMLNEIKTVLQNPEKGSLKDIIAKFKQQISEDSSVVQLEEVQLSELLDAGKGLLTQLKNKTIKDYISLLPEGISNPKMILEGLETKIKALEPEKYAEMISNFGIEIDQKTILEIIPKLKKVMENVPEKELKNIFDSAIKTFNEKPDEFISMLKNDSISNLFMTPQIKTALAAAGISWSVFSFVMAYAINSWFAEMQKKAGRLGVMKSLEDLSNEKYYANIIEDTKTTS